MESQSSRGSSSQRPAITKRSRDADGEKYDRTPTRRSPDYYQPANTVGQNHDVLGFLMGGFHSVNMVEQEGCGTILKTSSFNPSFSVVDNRSSGNLVHEAATKVCERLRKMVGKETPVVVASNIKPIKDLRGSLQWRAMKDAQYTTFAKLAYKYLQSPGEL